MFQKVCTSVFEVEECWLRVQGDGGLDHITQIKNFEDELVYSTDITSVKDLTGSKSNKDFKRDFIKEKDIRGKLAQYNFSIEKLWSRLPDGAFAEFGNDGGKVKY